MDYNLGKKEKEDTKVINTFFYSTGILSFPCKRCTVLGPM